MRVILFLLLTLLWGCRSSRSSTDYRADYSEMRVEARKAVLTGVEMKVSADTILSIARVELRKAVSEQTEAAETLKQDTESKTETGKSRAAILATLAILAILAILAKIKR